MKLRLMIASLSLGSLSACATQDPVAVLADGTPVVGRAFMPAPSDGAVTLECVVAEEGVLTACVVIEETPAGLGLGAAALRMARGSKVKADAGAVGDKVRFTSRFRLQD